MTKISKSIVSLYPAAFVVLLLLAAAASAEEVYRWPLDLPRDLSSSFGEYRPGRFHAGIDLRTGGVTGKPVYVAADGYVSRVRCSPWGYGKAVYVQFEDGNSAVYAHLEDYYDVLREYVRDNQHARRSYTVDLYPEPGRFPVYKGRQIAVSGSTGAGPPHLHYELRDSAGRPFNPKLAGAVWPDTVPPIFRSVLIAPEGNAGTVNGGFKPIILDVVRHKGGHYTTAPITASGRIGIAADVIDPGNDGIKMGVHVLRLTHENKEVFQVRHDYISYNNISNGAVAYHPFFLNEGHYLLLWRWSGNTTSLYKHSRDRGWFDVPETASELVIEAVDFSGNSVELTIPIQPESQGISATGGAGTGTVSMDCQGEYLTLTAAFSEVEGKAPELIAETGEDIQTHVFHRVTDRLWMVVFKPDVGGSYTLRVHHPRILSFEEVVHVFLRGSSGRTIGADGLQLTVKPDSPYGVMFVQLARVTVPAVASMPQWGDAWRIRPEATPVDDRVELTLPVGGENAPKARIYRKSGSGWRYVGGKKQGGYLTASVRTFGVYAVLEDTRAPVIKELSPPDDYHAKTQRPIIHAIISDVGSGISSYGITANGQWLLAAYDPDTKRLTWERDQELPSGDQKLVYRVVDNVGNETRIQRMIHIP